MRKEIKTPEEIKKGLECYITQNTGCCEDIPCRDCPHYDPNSAYTITACKDALAYIQQLEATQPKWISVEGRLPGDGQRVVAIAKNGMTGIMDYKADGTPFAARIFGRYFSEIIWWIPLPEPPEELW